jgi:cytochrome b
MTPGVQEQVKVWDIVVRTFHWLLVALFVLCYISGDIVDLLHAYLGYGILLLLGTRVAWGLIGTKYARFAGFIYGWKRVKEYSAGLIAGRPPHYLGHNPLAGWMIILLLVGLFLACWSGLEAYADQGHGPLAHKDALLLNVAYADEEKREGDEGELWGEVHEVLANFVLLLVIVHIAGVLIASLLHRENLVRSMWTGYKVDKRDDSGPA